MPAEVLHYLQCQPGKTYVDCTLGGCGHTAAIAEKIQPDGLLIGIDQDRDAVMNAKRILKACQANILLFHDNFLNLNSILRRLGIDAVDGILLDLGVSQHQIENSGRGFSFKKNEPLDMRMDAASETTTAATLVNQRPEKDLKQIFKAYGEERYAGRIARSIVAHRKQGSITSSLKLAEIVSHAVPRPRRIRQRIHPATRVFMALRIAVNQELDRLDRFLEYATGLLSPLGRMCVLSFHSLEDRIVKRRFKTLEKGCVCPPDLPKCVCGKKAMVRILTKKAIRPTGEEIRQNPMARSTRLRAIERCVSGSTNCA